MTKTILITGALMAMLAVILGAFGAHGLKNIVDAEAVKSFETGVRYQMYHAILLMILGLLPQLTEQAKAPVYYLVVGGVLLFSGSIYLLSLNSVTAFDFKKIGWITPVGGLLLIVAWGLLVIQFISSKK